MLQVIFVFLYKLYSCSMSNLFFRTSQKQQDDLDLELPGEKFTSPYI